MKVKVAQSYPTLWDPHGLYSPWNSPGLEFSLPPEGSREVVGSREETDSHGVFTICQTPNSPKGILRKLEGLEGDQMI